MATSSCFARGAFCALMLFFAAAVAAQPVDGSWTGTQDNGLSYNFTVSSGGTLINPLSFGYSGCSGNGTTTHNGNITISGNQFSGSGGFCPSFTTSGTFNGAIAASGTLTLTWVNSGPACPCSATQNRTWSASTPPPGPTADLAITKTDNGAVPALGATFNYTIVASNNGPTDVVGANVTDNFPASVSITSWTCSASIGSSCGAGGSGNINDSALNLLNGGNATYTATATVAGGAQGPIVNTATISTPAGVFDTVVANNAATQTTLIFGQANQWLRQSSGTSNFLNNVHFTSDSEGWVSGGTGTLLHTSNGGSSWSVVTNTGVGTAQGFNSVGFLNASVGWAGGTYSVIRTDNAGAGWTTDTFASTATSFFRNSIAAVSPTVAWAAGGRPSTPCRSHFRYTYTGAADFTEERFDNLCATGAGQWNRIFMLDADNGWSVGSAGLVIRISNASGTPPIFTDQSSGTSVSLRSVQMLNASRGWIVGDAGTLLTTADGGATPWTAQTSGISTDLEGIHFVDADFGWAVGDGGVIRASADGGLNWTAEASNVSNDLRRVFCRPAGICWAVGQGGTIVKRVGDRVFADDFDP